jgi:hypothetical protein
MKLKTTLNKTYWPHQVAITLNYFPHYMNGRTPDPEAWCYKHLRGRDWNMTDYVGPRTFGFKNEADAITFRLCWGHLA